jgi:hypothetical protein
MPIKMPETTKEGTPRNVEKSLWVKESLEREVYDVLNIDKHAPNNPAYRWATAVQLAQATDFVAHLKNQHTTIANSMGAGSYHLDLIRKHVPFAATLDWALRTGKILLEIRRDTPAIRKEMAEMARQGMIRPEYPPSGLQGVLKTQQAIHAMDTASRIALSRMYDNLVDRGWDIKSSKREFVQRLGEYNRRLMSPAMRWLREHGASPFVVAGRTFNEFSRRLLIGDPGFKAADMRTAALARTHMLAGLASAMAYPAIVNYFTTGKFGGRPGTPIGAIDTGTNNDKGQMRIIDTLQLLGIRRGLRGVGLQAVIEGVREGQTVNKIVGKGIDDITSTLAHPWIGPGPAAAYAILSGKRLDLRTGTWPFIAKQIPEGGAKQYLENARVTLKQQNPMLYSIAAPLFGGEEEPVHTALEYGKSVWSGITKAPGGAIGYKTVPPGSAFEPKYPPKHIRGGHPGWGPVRPRSPYARRPY